MKHVIFVAAVLSILHAQGINVPDTVWTYKTANGKDLTMDVFLPDGYEEGRSFPAFVVFHGGSWQVGTPDMQYPDCEYWRSRGMIAASVEYRLKDRNHVQVPLECVKDAKSAVRFLRKNARILKIDSKKIVAAGDSAGGQMAAALAMVPGANDDCDDLSISCIPNAVILYNPYWVTGCSPELTPPNFIKEGLPPFITFLGEQDPAITVEVLNGFHEALKAAGNDSEFYVGTGGKHGFCNGRNPMNPFFYWSLELEDRFLVKHGMLTGSSKVKRPPGVGLAVVADVKKSAAPVMEISDMFLKLDKNHSKTIDQEEYITCFEQSARFSDSNRDGLLTLEEFPCEGSFRTGDVDQRGTLTMKETEALYRQQFHARDTNKDGVVTPNEL